MDSIPQHKLLQFKPNTLEDIRKYYNLNQKRMNESIDILESWIKKQEHFIKKDFDRGYLERTIIVCKGSVERAKIQIDKIYTFRTLLPIFFSKLDVNTDLNSITRKVCLIPLPRTTKDLQRVILMKLYVEGIDSVDYILQFYRLSVLVCEYLKRHDYVNGLIMVIDYRKFNLMDLLTKLNLSQMQQILTIVIEGYGMRLQSIHLITTSSFIDLLMNTVKKFINPKLMDRIHTHSSIEDVFNYVDRSFFPSDYGGNDKSTTELIDDWLEELGSKDHQKYLEMMSGARTDESRRQKGRFNEEYVGMAGTFRTLNVD